MRIIFKIVRRHLLRRPGRTLLTIAGVASAMLLYVSVESLSAGLTQALEGGDITRTLVVYRENRYCPQTSHLPEHYAAQIRRVEGVESVLPVKVLLSNCRASLDVVSFQGTDVNELLKARQIDVVAGDVGRFQRELDTALVGNEFAKRRNLAVGDRFRFADVTVNIAGIFRSPEAVEEGLILTHLEFLQRSGPVNRLGTVTQFDVKVKDARQTPQVAEQIDALFKTAEEPTDTRPRLAFLEDATRELREILGFGRIFGGVCVLVVLALVANTVLMAVQERRREFGVLLTLGYKGRHLFALVLSETFLLTLIGAAFGLLCAYTILRWSHLAIGVEGISVTFRLSAAVFLKGVVVALATALTAGLLPALGAARAQITQSLASA